MSFHLSNIGLSIFCVICYIQLAASPANDHCTQAFTISNVRNWCSSPAQFTNVGAMASLLENPGCFPSYLADTDNDVWFKFTAIATVANISVIGAIKNKPSGTLQYPQFAVYQGSCSGRMREVACISDAMGNHIAETFVSNLVVGGTYFIRVDGRHNKTGTFQLCVNNFNPVLSPSSDCSSAVVLCDKSSFTVPSVNGAGVDRHELPPGLCVPDESQSAWYKWTCDKAGSLTFSLKPINPSDDLDFVLFLLPQGIENCSSKIPVRCMASGENVGMSYRYWQRCSGATGLSAHSRDFVETQGCDLTDDNFLAALQMESGQSYALMVNNFHNTGNGFSVEFGGTGTFAGPVAHFTVSKLKIETQKKLTIKNASSFSGGIKKWEWNFGVDASPQTARGQGPHTVVYSSTGKKSISLSIETGNGCKVTKVRTIEVVKPPPPPKVPEPEPPVEEQVASPPIVEDSPPPMDSLSARKEDSAVEEVAADDSTAAELPDAELGEQEGDRLQAAIEFLIKYEAIIYFKSDSSSLEEKDFETLEEVLSILNEHPGMIAIVEGHTNSIPSDEYCIKLSTARANSAIHWLQSRGIPETRIIRKVFGKKKMTPKDYSRQRRQRDQRVVIKLMEQID